MEFDTAQFVSCCSSYLAALLIDRSVFYGPSTPNSVLNFVVRVPKWFSHFSILVDTSSNRNEQLLSVVSVRSQDTRILIIHFNKFTKLRRDCAHKSFLVVCANCAQFLKFCNMACKFKFELKSWQCAELQFWWAPEHNTWYNRQ